MTIQERLGVRQGQLFQTARLMAGLSQREIAAMTGIANSTISRFEKGLSDPSYTIVSAIFEATGCKPFDSLESLGDDTVIEAFENAMQVIPKSTTDKWTSMWQRAGLLNEYGQVVDVPRVANIAGRASQLYARPNGVRAQMSVGLVQLLKLSESANITVAISGAAVFGSHDPRTAIIYCDKPFEIPIDLRPVQPSGVALNIFPLEQRLTYLRTDGFLEVSKARALVDAYASGGRTADKADGWSEAFERIQ